LESYVVSNVVTAALLAGAVAGLTALRRRPLWRGAGRELLRRRPAALALLVGYLVVAALDSIAWIDTRAAADDEPTPGVTRAFGDRALLAEPRSLIDRLFPFDFQEKSYSAPLADHELYGGAPLRYPGRHLLGTDILGRDVLQQTLKGARVALLIGGLTTLIVAPLALLVGVSAGYRGGWLDDVAFFVMATLASMPSLLLLIALIMVLGAGPLQVCIALGVTGWVGLARLVRAETLKIRELEYVQAARVLGTSEVRIVLRHVLPNLMHLVVVSLVLLFSNLVLSEVMLSWLGIGISGSWGRMIDQARTELSRDPIIWWNLIAASAALFGLILAVNQVADAVRDVLDPRTATEAL
jgi:peptide/nickel transport system permease protein